MSHDLNTYPYLARFDPSPLSLSYIKLHLYLRNDQKRV
jgi:hypothetical protein